MLKVERIESEVGEEYKIHIDGNGATLFAELINLNRAIHNNLVPDMDLNTFFGYMKEAIEMFKPDMENISSGGTHGEDFTGVLN